MLASRTNFGKEVLISFSTPGESPDKRQRLSAGLQSPLLCLPVVPLESPFKKRVQGSVMFCWEREEPCLGEYAKLKRPAQANRSSDANQGDTVDKKRAGTTLANGLLVKSVLNDLLLVSIISIYSEIRPEKSRENIGKYRKIWKNI